MLTFLRTPRKVTQLLLMYLLGVVILADACSSAKPADGDGNTKKDADTSLQVDGAITADAAPKADADAQDDAGLDDLPLDAAGNAELPSLDVVANGSVRSGCPGSDHSTCESRLCIEDAKAPDGKACAYKCSAACRFGYCCAAVNGGGDTLTIWVPNFAQLCEPCVDRKDFEYLVHAFSADSQGAV